MRIFTIGYEAATLGEVLNALVSAGVNQVVDVRAIAASRRPGFSKTALAASLAAAGLDYRHLRALGTPKEGRDAARKGDHEALARVYATQLALPQAQAEAAILETMALERPTALLCFERDPAACHRSLLIAAEWPDADVVDLYAGDSGRVAEERATL